MAMPNICIFSYWFSSILAPLGNFVSTINISYSLEYALTFFLALRQFCRVFVEMLGIVTLSISFCRNNQTSGLQEIRLVFPQLVA
jgi:hypothetical protein